MDARVDTAPGQPLSGLSQWWHEVVGWHLDPEIHVGGFYVPFALVVILAGFLLAIVVAWVFDRLGLTRFVWHPPLFLFALLIGCSTGLAILLFPR